MSLKAWQEELQVRRSAIPVDRRVHASSWHDHVAGKLDQDDVMFMLWESTVPGSGAPECCYREAAQSMETRALTSMRRCRFFHKACSWPIVEMLPLFVC